MRLCVCVCVCVSQAKELGQLRKAHKLLSHVNVIPWNPVDESEERETDTCAMSLAHVCVCVCVPIQGLEGIAMAASVARAYQLFAMLSALLVYESCQVTALLCTHTHAHC